MQRSTAALTLAGVIGAPAWLFDVGALPAWGQAVWAAAVLLTGAAGLALWALDRR